MLILKSRYTFRLVSFLLTSILLCNFVLAGIAEAAPPVPPTLPPFAITPTATTASNSSPVQSKPLPTVFPQPTRIASTVRPTASVPPTATPIPQPKLVSKPPTVSAAGAIAIDAITGRVLFSKDAHRRLPMASTTKIMTALTLLSIPGIDLNAETTVVQDDLVGEANMQLQVGERIRIMTLLIGLLTNSANEAGMAIARYAGGRLPGPADPIQRFVALMNATALSFGMYDSHYMNPHGLDEAGHYTSAYDLAISGWYASRYPTIMNIVRLDTFVAAGHSFYNVNNFIRRYPGATGLKPGLTDDAGRCLIASANNYGHSVIGIVLNAPDLITDIDTMMDYSFSLLTNRAEPQTTLPASIAYIGLPDHERLLPFDSKPLLDFFHTLGESIGRWMVVVRRPQ